MRVLAAAVVVLGVLGSVAAADDGLVASGPVEVAEVAGDPQEWGTTTDSVLTFVSHDFQMTSGTESHDSVTGGRVCTAGTCVYLAGLSLPSGALVRGLDLSACDSDPVAQARFGLIQAPRVPGQQFLVAPYGTSGTTSTPGCAAFSSTFATPNTVQNGPNGYALQVLISAGTNMQWTQFRVRYRLQVNPAPAVATFPNDVPTTSPYFRFVEAMAASGLTGGCGTGRFCPDTPVTRGQFAVFLASALGLHYPN